MSQLMISELQNTFSQPGVIVSICTRPERLAPVVFHQSIIAVENKGLEGDRYQGSGNRQVTLIAYENLQAVAAFLGKQVSPGDVRRNIVVKGINLIALKGKQFRVGDALLEYTGECHPCSRMETNLGTGGYNAMRGNGGITARIIASGLIKLGDKVSPS